MLTFRTGFNSFRREIPHTLEGLSIAVHHCLLIGPEFSRDGANAGRTHLRYPLPFAGSRDGSHGVAGGPVSVLRGQPKPVSPKLVVSKQ